MSIRSPTSLHLMGSGTYSRKKSLQVEGWLVWGY
ncbi:hypothetical protein CUMW_253480 [Citrus unshiu]|uniref:Uncharacterized protein n=1 Tax=Citrus unshiu TaxID=55188 RepID=A0A2H5QR02_CITUN|nr:hypothetical protein CUMW_253480 [Citrus unshiu]